MSFLEKNLEVLARINPGLAKWVATEPDRPWIRLSPGGNGNPGLVLDLPSGSLDVYGPGDPVGNINRQIDLSEYRDRSRIFILGIGLGYPIDILLGGVQPDGVIIAAEVQAHLIRLTLSRADYRADLETGRLVLVGPDEDLLDLSLARLPALPGGQADMVHLVERYVDAMGPQYNRLKDICWQSLLINATNQDFLRRYGMDAVKNHIRAIPRTIRRPASGSLAGIAENIPAILVSTGPSLGKNIRVLKKAQGKSLIIAAGQALRSLLAYGVKPDIVTFVDIHERAVGHLRGLFGVRRIPLFVPNMSFSGVPNRWQGSLIITAMDEKLHPSIQNIWAAGLKVERASNVALYNLGLAAHLKADPIIMIGQDLSVSRDETHFSQVDHRLKMSIGDNNQVHLARNDPANPHQRTFNGGLTEMVPGYFGGMVETIQAYYLQIHQLETAIRERGLNVINSTEGGVNLAGTRRMSLESAVRTSCTRPVTIPRIRETGCPTMTTDSEIERMLDVVAARVSLIQTVIDHSRSWLRLETDLRKAEAGSVDSPKKQRRVVKLQARADQADRAINQAIGDLPELVYTLQTELEAVNDAKKQAGAAGPEARGRVFGAYRELLKATIDKGRRIEEAYRDCADRLDDYWVAREGLKESPDEVEPLVNLARAMEGLGEIAEAVDLLTGRIEELPPNTSLGTELGRLAIVNENYRVARQAVEYLRATPNSDSEAERLEARLTEIVIDKLARADVDLAAEMFARPLFEMSKVLEIEPENNRAVEVAAICEENLGAQAEAAEAKAAELWESERQAVDPAEEYRSLIDRARAAGQNGQPDQALKILGEAVDLIPERLEARWGMATTLHLTGRMDQAVELFDQLIKEFPQAARLRYESGLVRLLAGRVETGLEELTRAAQDLPEAADALTQAADQLAGGGRFDLAAQCLLRHLQAIGRNPLVWTKLAECMIRMNQPDQARAALKEALQLDPEFGPAKAAMGHLGSPGQSAAA